MPFVKRTIHPKNVRRHGPLGNYLVFEEHDEVTHHSLVNVLKQLSSLTWNAESIFKEIEIESNALSQRCTQVKGRLEKLSQSVTHLNPKEVEIPVSTLEIEQKIPFYLHYRSSDLQDEDLFTVDSRNPSLIHLHQNARSDWNGILRGSTAYSKSNRPRSLDPSLLIDDAEPSSVGCAPQGGGVGMNGGNRFSNAKSTANIVASPELTELFSPRGILPTPTEKVQQDCSQKIGKLISVDTSGSQYDRKVSYRKSQRLSCSGASVVKRRKNQQKYRDRHKTLTALPGSISHELEISSASTNRSSAIEHVVDRSSQHQSASRPLSVATNNHVITSSTSLRGNSMKFPFLPFRRNTKHRNTIAGTDVVRSSQPQVDDVTQIDATSNHKSPSGNGGAPMVTGENRDIVTSQDEKGRDIREFADRTSSGFWSGTESARHSTTSDTVNNNNKAAIKPKFNDVTTFGNGVIGVVHDKDRNGSHHEICAPSLSASTTSINSRLSTFDTTSEISSVFHETPNGTLPPSKHFFPCSPSPLITSASQYERSQMLKTPPGSYRYMNGDYDPEENGGGRSFLKHEIDSPVDPIIIDGHHHSGFSSLFRPRKNQNGDAPPSYYGTSSFGKSSSPPSSSKPTTTNGDDIDGSDEFERRKRQLQRKHQQQQEQLLMQQREEEERLLKMQESSRSPRLSDFTPTKSPTKTNGYHHNTSSSTNGSDVADSTTPKEPHTGPSLSAWRQQRNHSMTSPTPSSTTTTSEKPEPPRRWSSLHGSSPLHDAKQIMAILESPPKRKNRCSSITSSASTLSSPPCSVTPSRVNSVTSSKRSSTPESSSSSSSPPDHEDTTPTNPTPPHHDLSRLEKPHEKGDDVIVATAESICDTPNVPVVTGGGVKNLFKSQSVRQRDIPKPATPAKLSRSSLKLTSSGSVVTSVSPAAPAQKTILSPTRAVKKPLIMGEKPKSKTVSPSLSETTVKKEVAVKRAEQQNKDEKEKSPSVTSPKRPAIKPKPVVLPKPKFLRQSSREVEEVVSKTANARAAFFGLPTPTTPPSGNSSNSNSPRDGAPTSQKKVEAPPFAAVAAEEESPKDDDVYDHVIHSLQKESSSSLNESDSTTTTTPNPIASSTPETTLQNNSDVTTPMDGVESSDSSSYLLVTRSMPEVVISDDDTSSILSSTSMLSNLSGNGVRLRPKFIVPLKDGSSERPSSRLKQTRYSNGSNLNGLKSPLSKSPSSTLERKPRYSTTSLERRRKNGTTSRNDFKALLMQSTTSRSTSNMSAAEKLKLTSPANKSRTTSSDDMGSASRISDMNGRRASTSNIQSTMMRTGRYSSRNKNEIRWSYGGGPLNFSLSKKHPPLSHSGRYTAIRSKTPTRVMNSISEDADEYSPELGVKSVMKSMVNVRSETDV